MNRSLTPVIVTTDGSCLGNPGPGGWAVVRRCAAGVVTLTGGETHTTNNRMELMGPLQAILSHDTDAPMIIRSDSQYVVDGMNRWISGWVKRGWRGANGKPVKNLGQWKELLAATEGRDIKWEWVKGHADDPDNELCDGLAKEQAEIAKAASCVQ